MKYQHIQFSEPSRSSIQSGQEQVLDVQQVQKIVQEGQHDQFPMASQNQFPTDNVSINKKKMDNLRQRQLIQSSQNEYSLNDQNQMVNCQNRGKNLRTKIQCHRNIKKIRKLENTQQKNKNKNKKISSYKSSLNRQKKINNKISIHDDYKAKFKIKNLQEQIFNQSQQGDRIEIQGNQNKQAYYNVNNESQNNRYKQTYLNKNIISTAKDYTKYLINELSQSQQYVMQSSQVDTIKRIRVKNESLQHFIKKSRNACKIKLNSPDQSLFNFNSNNLDQINYSLNKNIHDDQKFLLNITSSYNSFNQEKQSSAQQNLNVSNQYTGNKKYFKISNKQLRNHQMKKNDELENQHLQINLTKIKSQPIKINHNKDISASKPFQRMQLTPQRNPLKKQKEVKTHKQQQVQCILSHSNYKKNLYNNIRENNIDDNSDFSVDESFQDDQQDSYEFIKPQQQICRRQGFDLQTKTIKRAQWKFKQNVCFISMLSIKEKKLKQDRKINLDKFIKYCGITDGKKVFNRYRHYFNKQSNRTFQQVIQTLKKRYNINQDQVQQQIQKLKQYQQEEMRVLQQKEKYCPHQFYNECFRNDNEYELIDYTKGKLFFKELNQHVWCSSVGILVNSFTKSNKHNKIDLQYSQQLSYQQPIQLHQNLIQKEKSQGDPQCQNHREKKENNTAITFCSMKIDLQFETNSILQKMNILQENINNKVNVQKCNDQLLSLHIDNLIQQHQTLDMIYRALYQTQFSYQQYLSKKQNKNKTQNQTNIVTFKKQNILLPNQQLNQIIVPEDHINITNIEPSIQQKQQKQLSQQILIQQQNQQFQNLQQQVQTQNQNDASLQKKKKAIQQFRIGSYEYPSPEFSYNENLKLLSWIYAAKTKFMYFPQVQSCVYKELSQFLMSRNALSCYDRIRRISKYAQIQNIEQNIDILLQKCKIEKQQFEKEVNKLILKLPNERHIIYLEKDIRRWKIQKQMNSKQKLKQAIKNIILSMNLQLKLIQ